MEKNFLNEKLYKYSLENGLDVIIIPKKDCVKRLMFLFILKKFLFISFTIVVVIFIYKKVQYSQSYIYDAIDITMMNNII